MNLEQLKKLATALTKSRKQPGLTFSFQNGEETVSLDKEAMNAVLREELNKLCGVDYNNFDRNKHDIFDLIQVSVDGVVAPELEKSFMGFAEVRQFGPADQPMFNVVHANKHLRERAFITKATSAGVYEVFRIDNPKKLTVDMLAIGGGAQISIEDFRTGRIDWNEMVDIIRLGMEDRVYDEVLAALAKMEADLPTVNKCQTTDFDAKAFNKVLATVSVYGAPVIMCTEAFAREITEGYQWASESEKLARRHVGYLADYKGAKIVVLPQSFKDNNNAVKVVDDSKAYIYPAGNRPLFYIALQGNLQLRDVKNEDWSVEIQAYKRFGVAAMAANDLGVATITSLK
jgi:hypothetical protein